MRFRNALIMSALAAMTLMSPAGAAGLPYGRNGMPQKFPDLGPVGNGRRFFLEYNCYSCHGNNGGGAIGPNIQYPIIDDVYEAVMRGIPYAGMPSFRKYATPTDINNLVAYLNSIDSQQEPMWFDWWKPYPGK